MNPFSEKALKEKAEAWEEKTFPEQGINPDYAYDDVIHGFIAGWKAREEDLRALLEKELKTAQYESDRRKNWVNDMGVFAKFKRDYETIFMASRYWTDRACVFRELLAELSGREGEGK